MEAQPHRVLLYSHDSVGLGHLRRNLTIAHHLSAALPQATGRHATGLLVTGLAPIPPYPLPEGFDWLTLPGVTKGGAHYRPRRLLTGLGPLIALRSAVLHSALVGLAPGLVIVDRHLHGVGGELHAPLRRLKEEYPDTRIVLGLRDVLDAPEAAAAEWRALGHPRFLRRLIDEIWVYGDPTVHDPFASGEVPSALRDLAHFTGYLSLGRSSCDRSGAPPESPFILTTVGGGADGEPLLRAAAQMTPPAGHDHLLVAGPQLSEGAFRAVQALAGPRTRVHRCLPGLGRHLHAASAVITMGGYNTIVEVLATSTPALVAPREEPRREQLIRARSLERAGAVDVIRQQDLSPRALGQWARTAVHHSVDRSGLARDGLDIAGRRATTVLGGHCALALAGGAQ